MSVPNPEPRPPTPGLPADNHVHSEWSYDTHGTSMLETCRRAVEVGLPSVAFTEHVDFTAWGEGDGAPGLELATDRFGVRPLDVEGYLECVQRCRDEFGSLRILTGVEAGEPHRFAGSVAPLLAGGRFERVLGSLHSIVHHGQLIGVDYLRGRVGPDQMMTHYLAELLELVKSSSAFEVLAHADYPRRQWPPERRFDERVYEEGYRAVFRALAASDRVLEINTRSPLWSVRLVGWWRDEGGRAVSFGSDAHTPWRVGAQFATAVDIAEAAGFRPGRDRYDFWRR